MALLEAAVVVVNLVVVVVDVDIVVGGVVVTNLVAVTLLVVTDHIIFSCGQNVIPGLLNAVDFCCCYCCCKCCCCGPYCCYWSHPIKVWSINIHLGLLQQS